MALKSNFRHFKRNCFWLLTAFLLRACTHSGIINAHRWWRLESVCSIYSH